MTPAPALELRGLTKSFGAKRAVDALDLTVPAGFPPIAKVPAWSIR